MTRKIRRPLDFSSALEETGPDPIDEAVASIPDEPAPDMSFTGETVVEAQLEPSKPEPKPASAVTRTERSAATRPERSAVTAAREPAPAPTPVKGGGWPYGLALIATLAWLVVPAMLYAAGDSGPFGAIALPLLILLAAGPILPFWASAYIMAQGQRLAAEARFARAQADDMIHPIAVAASGASDAVDMVRDQIEAAVSAASQARHELITLREVLASETAHLTQAAAQSAEAAARITQSVGDERRELAALTEVLKAQTDEVEESITRQSAMVAQAADLADARIKEAEARLSASAADLTAATGEATTAAKTAGEDLSRQAARLEAAGTVVVEQVRTVEDSLAEQRAALVTVSHELRAEQENFGAEVESRQAQLTSLLTSVKESASEIVQNAETSSESLKILIENTADRFRALGDAAAEERDHFSAEVLKSVGAISEAARSERELFVEQANAGMDALTQAAVEAANAARAEREKFVIETKTSLADLGKGASEAAQAARAERDALVAQAQETVAALSRAAEEASAKAAAQTDAARSKVDQLSEAAFAAGQQAEAAFEARLADARALIERSAALVEEAGVQASSKLAEGLQTAQATVERLENLIRDVDARAARLPEEAQQRQAEIQTVVEKGVENLLGAARRAADETQAIDAAFQERVRRNYEMLSEAVRLMGVVGGAAASPRPPRLTPRPAAAVTPAPAPAAEAPAFDSLEAPPPPAEPPAASPTLSNGNGADIELRPRLRLTPEAIDEEVFASESDDVGLEAPAPPAAAPAAEENKELTWREILSHVDEPEDEPSGAGISEEIRALGIDPDALLPRTRIDELAIVLQARDPAGAREVVRQLAPAAMRRLSRRILTDPSLRGRVGSFIKAFEDRIDQAAKDDAVAALLATDEGRAFLLTDAAVSEY